MELFFDKTSGDITYGDDYEFHVGKRIIQTLRKNTCGIHQIEITSGMRESHGSVLLKSIRVAEALKSEGLVLGDVVWICANNHCNAALPLIASTFIGTIPVNLAVGMTYYELKHILSLATPKIVFTDSNMRNCIKRVLKDASIDIEIVVFGNEYEDYTPFSEYINLTGTEDVFVCEDFDPKTTTALIACSSGTTGMPKLVSISHQSATLLVKIPDAMSKLKMGSSVKTFLNFSSMYWVTGVMSILFSCLNGTTRIQSYKQFSAALFKIAMETYKPQRCYLTPSAVAELYRYPKLSEINFSTLGSMIVGGSMTSKHLVDHFRKLLTNGIIHLHYGSTETGNMCSNLENIDYSVGTPLPWVKWKVVDPDTEKKLGPYEHGEMRARTPYLFQGYYNNPEATAAAFDSENYYKTGDLVYYDDAGKIYFVDRIKEMIKYKNHQITTIEIEQLICSLPEVCSAAVVGLPDPQNGELPMAFVQLARGEKITAQKIKDLVKDTLSDCKQLRGGVVFIENLPKTYVGKVDRKALRILKTQVQGE